MAFSVNTICCCNLLIPSISTSTATSTNHPTSPSSALLFPSHHRRPLNLNKVNQISCSIQRKREDGSSSWSSQCLLGMMACIIINTGFYSSDHHQATAAAAAEEPQAAILVGNTAGRAGPRINKKWSDKMKICPAWRLNSLETIVPENLPRPSAHRRSESVTTTLSSSSSSSSSSPSPHETSTAPLLNSTLKSNVNNCFSM